MELAMPIDHDGIIIEHSKVLEELKANTSRLREQAHNTNDHLQSIKSGIELTLAKIEELNTIPILNGNENTINFKRNEFHQTTYKKLTTLDNNLNTHLSEWEREKSKKIKSWKMVAAIGTQIAVLLGILYTLIQIISSLHSMGK